MAFLAPNDSIVAVALALMWVGRVSMALSVAIHEPGMPMTPTVRLVSPVMTPMSFIGTRCLPRVSSRL